MYSDPKVWQRVRERALQCNDSLREIARTEHLSRGTVRKMVRAERIPSFTACSADDVRSKLYTALRRMRAFDLDAERKNAPLRSMTLDELCTEGVRMLRSLRLDDATSQFKALMSSVGKSHVLGRPVSAGAATAKRGAPRAVEQEKWTKWLFAVERRERPDLACGNEVANALVAKVRAGPYSHRRRALVILASSSGFSRRAISRELGASRNTIVKYITTYQVGGLDALFGRHHRSLLSDSPEFKDMLFATLHQPPSVFGFNRTTWRLADLKTALASKGHPASVAVICRAIRAAGYRWRKARTVLTSTDKSYDEKLAKVTAILRNLKPDERFFSIDEYGPFAVKCKGGARLVPLGQRPTVEQWQQSKGCLILTAALELSANQVTHFYSPRKDTGEMIRMAKVLLIQYGTASKLYLSWDAASWHISKQLKDFIESHNTEAVGAGGPLLETAPLPASAQFLNVIESVFSGMSRAIIHNSDYASTTEAMAAIDRYFSERNQHFTETPRRAGNKIWGQERVTAAFSASNNCKDPAYR